MLNWLAYMLEYRMLKIANVLFHCEDLFRSLIYCQILLNISQDYVGNKRLELSGQLMSLLFEVFIFSCLFTTPSVFKLLTPLIF
jgi:hypothetical protein